MPPTARVEPSSALILQAANQMEEAALTENISEPGDDKALKANADASAATPAPAELLPKSVERS